MILYSGYLFTKSLTTWLYNAAQTLKNNDTANMWVMCGLAFLSLVASEEKQKEIMEEIVMHLRSMRDNWKEVMKKAKSTQA